MHDEKKKFDTFNILPGNLLNQIYHFNSYISLFQHYNSFTKLSATTIYGHPFLQRLLIKSRCLPSFAKSFLQILAPSALFLIPKQCQIL